MDRRTEDRPTLNRPLVLCIGGHDPSGGAGIQADAEATGAAGAFALTVISALTEQNSCGLRRLHPQPADQIMDHCRTLFADSAPSVLKLGLLGSSRAARVVATLIDDHPELPVVLDPVLTSGAGQQVADAAVLNQIRHNLLHRTTLITPNLPEAQTLSDQKTPDDCAERLLAMGVRWVLITGTHDDTDAVINRLYGINGQRQQWRWPRLPGEYHGSGCTLASAIAARLALGLDMIEAVAAAQDYTWSCLEHAFRSGRCQLTPQRLRSESSPVAQP